ncbi:MAG: GreA/GreB family elongation factor [Parcubacteria group bacterium]|nr:GreA/GreB family elongation factor [Parcubacteria group bacterium]
MLNEKKFYLTKQGLDKIEKNCEKLKRIRASKVEQRYFHCLRLRDKEIEHASFVADLNSLESKIIKLEKIINNTELIKTPSKRKQDVIDLGATVRVEVENGRTDRFTVVGTIEADPEIGKISFRSPLGKALLGRRVGDYVRATFAENMVYKIRKIGY